MTFIRTWVGFIGCRDGDIRNKNLVDERWIMKKRWVRYRNRRFRRFNEIRVDILRLITIFKSKVLKESVCRQWGGKKGRRKEERRIRENRGLNLGEEKRKSCRPEMGLCSHG